MRYRAKGGWGFSWLVVALIASSPHPPPTGPLTCMQLSLNQLSVAVDGSSSSGGAAAMVVEAVGSPDRRGVVFGRRKPPTHTPPASPSPARASGAGPGAGAVMAAQAAAAAAAAHQRPDSAATAEVPPQNGPLLAAALQLQGIGGRSVALLHRSSLG